MNKNDLKNPATLLATWFGTGLLPSMPGTWGSLAALPFAWIVSGFFGWPGLAIFVVGVFLAGLWSTGEYVRRRGDGETDPGAVVIDEVAGQCLTLLLVPPDVVLYGAGFFLFRLADILKPWPVSWADRRIGGALGVMVDDVLAALYAGGILHGLLWWMEVS
jgi:phosphatidylglycerophosphatase A